MEIMKKYYKQFMSAVGLEKFMSEYGGQIRKIAFLVALIVLGLIVYSTGAGGDDSESTASSNSAEESSVEASDNIFVDIGGAVNEPMLAELPEGSRVEDAIIAAGGLTADADISGINRAEFLEDGTKIYIPAFERDDEGNIIENSVSSGTSSSAADGKVNLNTADSETLQTLTGIGPVTAEKIIQYRENTGRFKSTEDLKNVSGIGDKTFEKLEDYITI